MPHKVLIAALLSQLVFASVARAENDADHTLEAIFHLFDENDDGFITIDEADRYLAKTFAEMDSGGSGRIGVAEFRQFSFGLADVAAAEGKSEAYEKAKDAIFNRWDRGKKGFLTLADYRAGVVGEAKAARADVKPDPEGRVDFDSFKRARFVRQLMESLN